MEKQIFSLSSDLNKINYKKENDSKIILEKQNKLTTYTETIDKLNKNQEKESSALIEIDNRLTIIKKINTFVKRDFRGYLLRDVIDYLKAGDVLVVNNTKVIPARLYGTKVDTGAKIEVFLLKQNSKMQDEHENWEVLIKPSKRVKSIP